MMTRDEAKALVKRLAGDDMDKAMTAAAARAEKKLRALAFHSTDSDGAYDLEGDVLEAAKDLHNLTVGFTDPHIKAISSIAARLMAAVLRSGE